MMMYAAKRGGKVVSEHCTVNIFMRQHFTLWMFNTGHIIFQCALLGLMLPKIYVM